MELPRSCLVEVNRCSGLMTSMKCLKLLNRELISGSSHQDWVFTKERAKKLKAAGLTGVMVSLDHFDPSFYNEFRGDLMMPGRARQAVFGWGKSGVMAVETMAVVHPILYKKEIIWMNT